MVRDNSRRLKAARRPETPVPGATEPDRASTVTCSACRKEIPASAAINPEAGEYALYFCGLNCYRHWLTAHEWHHAGPR